MGKGNMAVSGAGICSFCTTISGDGDGKTAAFVADKAGAAEESGADVTAGMMSTAVPAGAAQALKHKQSMRIAAMLRLVAYRFSMRTPFALCRSRIAAVNCKYNGNSYRILLNYIISYEEGQASKQSADAQSYDAHDTRQDSVCRCANWYKLHHEGLVGFAAARYVEIR